MEGVGLVIKGVSSVKGATAPVFSISTQYAHFLSARTVRLGLLVSLGEEKVKARIILELFVIAKSFSFPALLFHELPFLHKFCLVAFC